MVKIPSTVEKGAMFLKMSAVNNNNYYYNEKANMKTLRVRLLEDWHL